LQRPQLKRLLAPRYLPERTETFTPRESPRSLGGGIGRTLPYQTLVGIHAQTFLRSSGQQ
jgi:hypothetical protein